MVEGNTYQEYAPFRPLTHRSLSTAGKKLVVENVVLTAEIAAKSNDGESYSHVERKLKPNRKLQAGNKLPLSLEHQFRTEHVGKPLEDIDEFYQHKKTFVVIGRDKRILRFSATKSFHLLSPFSPVRRAATYILSHPLFGFFIILTIIVNCVFMTFTHTPGGEISEYVFISIYTLECLIKIIARGFVLTPFTYLRDPWNWLDFGVIIVAYLTIFVKRFNNLFALRTFRVLRALKTIAVVPGLKTIVGALLVAVVRLRDVTILTLFSLSVFALVGLELYRGKLQNKCVLNIQHENATKEEWKMHSNNKSNWYPPDSDFKLMCGQSSTAGQCPEGYTCHEGLGDNPNFDYTSFDNFGWALLCSYRLMVQDFWENLYMLVLRAEGVGHAIFFFVAILLGSFYLVNLILAIVAKSYDEQKKSDMADAEELTAETKYDQNNILMWDGTISKYTGLTPKSSHVDLQDASVVREPIDHVENSTTRHVTLTQSRTITSRKKSLKVKVYRHLCSWETPSCLKTIQQWFGFVILDAFVDVFIVLCIVANTVVMAMDRYPISESTEHSLEMANIIFTYIFAVEACMKIIALGLIRYLQDGWNCFDVSIVLLSLFEMTLAGVIGLSVLRTFRLLRVFKLAKSWPTLNKLMRIVTRTIGALASLTCVLGLVIFIFAVTGQQLFSGQYKSHYDEATMPRWNFLDFLHSFMIVFRVLCGEWIESMWYCMNAAGWVCVPFFLLTYIIGNLVCLNLVLALLLSSFSSENLSSSSNEDEAAVPNKIGEAFNRFSRFSNWLNMLFNRTKSSKRTHSSPIDLNIANCTITDGKHTDVNADVADTLISDSSFTYPNGEFAEDMKVAFSDINDSLDSKHDTKQGVERTVSHKVLERNAVVAEYPETPGDCFCTVCRSGCVHCIDCGNTSVRKMWWKCRCGVYRLILHRYFEIFIIIMIIASSIALAMEDVYLEDRVVLKQVLEYMDKVFTIVFLVEMILKWIGFGFKYYFTNAWCWLDFIIVGISIVLAVANMFNVGDAESLRAMRTLRALRPLRAVSRWEGMRVVVDALLKAIPPIFNVLLVCLVFWLIFGIMGVQFFKGKFYRCIDATGVRLSVAEIANKTQCLDRAATENFTWVNAPLNFDNVLNAYLALLQVATFKGWIDIIRDSVDSPSTVDMQPDKETNSGMYIYFVLFIVLGSFFGLKLFVGVIIDKYSKQKQLTEGFLELFLTENQKKYYRALKHMRQKRPTKAIPRPNWFPANVLFDLTTHKTFDIVIMILILLNMCVLMLEHHGQSEAFSSTLHWINVGFVVIITGECIIKIIAFRHFYFKNYWNVFDFVIVVLSVVGLVFGDYVERHFVSPTLLRVLRIFRISRILRLVESAKGIRTLLFSLVVSLPALFNIGLLLFLILFIYATFGMNLFKDLKYTGGLDNVFNFETIVRGIVTLFQMCTSAGWDGVFLGLINDKDCDESSLPGGKNRCGSYPLGVIYLVSYLIITFLVVTNMYIAVILENFNQTTEEVQQGLTPEEFDIFYDKWQIYDPDATRYIPLDALSEFVDNIEKPLRIPKPNHSILGKLNIPIYEGDLCYCRDILDELTKYFLGTTNTSEIPIKELIADKKKIKRKVISSTLMRQRERHAAKTILNVYKKYRLKRANDIDLRKDLRQYEDLAISNGNNSCVIDSM